MKLVNATASDLSVYHRVIRIAAGLLDPQTRADEVRVIRARLGLPAGMPVRPDLERRRPSGTYRPIEPSDDER
jgi:hypothetical protein